MMPVLKRLNTQYALPLSFDSDNKTWPFTQYIETWSKGTLALLVKNHLLLRFEYSVHCTLLTNKLKINSEGIFTPDEEEGLKIALMLSEILEQVYLCPELLGSDEEEVKRLREEQAIYREWLARLDYQFSSTKTVLKEPLPVDSAIRHLTAQLNWLRLGLLRTRRLWVLSKVMARDSKRFQTLDNILGPFLAYVGWIFFLPRLLINIGALLKQMLPDADYVLPFKQRLIVQMNIRGYELANDVAWFTSGVLNCFVLLGLLSPFAFYATVGLQAYDVILAGLRAHTEMKRLHSLLKQYKTLWKEGDTKEEERTEIIAVLEKRFQYEQNRLYMQMANTIVILAAALLAMPVLSINPIIPLVGASVAVLATIGFYVALKIMDKYKPAAKIPSIQKMPCFFQPTPSQQQPPPGQPKDKHSPPLEIIVL